MEILIIGNGIAGVTAARNIRKKSNSQITVISSESEYFFSRTALMYVYMGHMTFENTQPYENDFWSKNNIELCYNKVVSVDYESKSVNLVSGEKISYDKLIIAAGSKPNYIGWKGQDLQNVQGLYSRQDLDSMMKNTEGAKSAVVAGGGLIGIEMTEMLLSRGIEVHFLIRENNFWGSVLPKEESNLLMNHFKKHHGLVMHYEEELDEILPCFKGEKVSSIKTKKGTIIKADFVGLCIGVVANIDFLKNSELKINRGIVVNEFLETNQKDVFAIGDCAEIETPEQGRRAVEQVWYTGRMMGEVVADNVIGEKRKYLPGQWFNSAKFFDIEYQTYGLVPSKLAENQAEFVWQHQDKELLIHFVYSKENDTFLGVNTFGIRLRHEVFDKWLNDKKSIHFVLENLASANFDPEFYKVYELDIIEQFNYSSTKKLILKPKTWWRNLLKENQI
jgi:NAD(P)H-nitrite reductase large subunit